jgi:hypothetical protein
MKNYVVIITLFFNSFCLAMDEVPKFEKKRASIMEQDQDYIQNQLTQIAATKKKLSEGAYARHLETTRHSKVKKLNIDTSVTSPSGTREALPVTPITGSIDLDPGSKTIQHDENERDQGRLSAKQDHLAQIKKMYGKKPSRQQKALIEFSELECKTLEAELLRKHRIPKLQVVQEGFTDATSSPANDTAS